jgi:hypothetical protein
MLTLADARRLALSVPGATEEPHHGMPSFRVRGKIFATVPDDGHIRVMVDADVATAVAAAEPDAFEELRWGAKLAGVTVDLAHADPGAVGELLEQAWRQRATRKLIAEYDARDA